MEFIELKKPTAKTNNLVIQELGDEILIYDLETNKAYNLNETSGFVWQNCDGKKGISDLALELQKKAKQPVKQEVVWLALNELKSEGLVSFEVEAPVELAKLDRRQVIKKIGLTAMVTLPLVTSLVAPTAAMAQSSGSGGSGGTVEPGGVCQDDRDCRQVLGQPSRNCNTSNCDESVPVTTPRTKCCG
jgi:hypothetical protein